MHFHLDRLLRFFPRNSHLQEIARNVLRSKVLAPQAGDEFPSAVVNLDGCLIRSVARGYGGVSELMDSYGCFLVFGTDHETHEVARVLSDSCPVFARGAIPGFYALRFLEMEPR